MKNLKVSNKKGFSLVELLVVIAVIGVIAAIAIPAMTNIFGNSRTAKSKRNAQNIASVYSAARAAGASFIGNGGNGTTVSDITSQLASGINGSGSFSTSKFQISLAPTEIMEATAFLDAADIINGVLKYTGTAP